LNYLYTTGKQKPQLLAWSNLYSGVSKNSSLQMMVCIPLVVCKWSPIYI